MKQRIVEKRDIIKFEVVICNKEIQKVEIVNSIDEVIKVINLAIPLEKRDEVFDEFLELCEIGMDCSYFDSEIKIEIKKLYFKISEV
nr:MAG TPA: hypothetical protein [Caudoviricetes sp.]